MKHKAFKTSLILMVVLLFGLIASPAMAGTFTQIPQPNAVYQATTTKIDISGLTLYQNYSSITDGTLTVTFSSPLEKRGPVPTGWATWSSPPWSESATPDVLFATSNSLNMTLSQPVTILGFELEPNTFTSENYTVDFVLMSGPTIVGTINMPIDGSAGARLVAASVTGGSFDKVKIVGTPALGFAIAQVRYSITPVPPGWSKGNKKGWSGSTPPGLDKKGKTPPGFDKGNKNGWYLTLLGRRVSDNEAGGLSARFVLFKRYKRFVPKRGT